MYVGSIQYGGIETGTETVTYPEFFSGTPFLAEGLRVAATPLMGPGQSPGGGPEGEAPKSSWDLVI